jgi:hypothetical protein
VKSNYALVWLLMAETNDFDINMEQTHPFDVAETKMIHRCIIKQRINNQAGMFSVLSTTDQGKAQYG